MTNHDRYAEHPLDVLSALILWQETEPCALAVITRIKGGAVRDPGALMAVSQSGKIAGYISGGCIDSDIVLQAQLAIKSDQPRTVHYGAGSPFVDLPLPCGGTIILMIIPQPSLEVVSAIIQQLTLRRPALVHVLESGQILCNSNIDASQSPELSITYTPKVRLRIAGRGADCLSLARLGQFSNFDIKLQMTDSDDVAQARASGLPVTEYLTTPDSLPDPEDDCWTAFILAFHDQSWEASLLKQALDGPAFYIGAVGSRRTHEKRCTALKAMDVSPDQIGSIHAPVGLVHSLRDASKLAVSTLAEIVQAETLSSFPDLSETAVILLAAGNSSRFEQGDKLLASPLDKPLLAHAAALARQIPAARRVAVTQPDQTERQQILKAAGWQIVINPDAETGQSSSIRAAISELMMDEHISRVVICLADMPNVSTDHILKLCHFADKGHKVVFSSAGNSILPPAIFSGDLFTDLLKLTGDQGARQLSGIPSPPISIPLSAKEALDIDTLEDLRVFTLHAGP